MGRIYQAAVITALLVVCLTRTSAYIKVDCPITLRLGVSNQYIPDTHMTSSSHLSSRYHAKYGRIDGKSAWCPGPSKTSGMIPQSDAWLQVDLGVSHIVCSVAVQGSYSDDRWVTMYRLSYSTDGVNWMKERYFSTGNRDRHTVKFSYPFLPRIARYVRFNLAKNRYHNWPCMRVEIFGNKVFEFKKNIIIYDKIHKMYLLVKPNGKETPDKRGNVKMIYTDQITKIPGQTHLSSYVHYLTKNNAIYPDIPPRASSLYAGTHVLIVLPKNRYLEGKIIAAVGNNLYEVRRSDNGKTEVMRRAYFRQKGLDACELDNQCPKDTTCHNDNLGRPARYYCLCHKGFTEAFKGGATFMQGRCRDIDECREDTASCPSNSKCTNTIGSFHCNCSKGYHKTENNQCIDIDECQASPCESGFTCHNTLGAYKCQDIDECLSEPCFQGEVCINTHGSFRCEIPNRGEFEDVTSVPSPATQVTDIKYEDIQTQRTDPSYKVFSVPQVKAMSLSMKCNWKVVVIVLLASMILY